MPPIDPRGDGAGDVAVFRQRSEPPRCRRGKHLERLVVAHEPSIPVLERSEAIALATVRLLARKHQIERRVPRIARPRDEVVDLRGVGSKQPCVRVEASPALQFVEPRGVLGHAAAIRAEEERFELSIATKAWVVLAHPASPASLHHRDDHAVQPPQAGGDTGLQDDAPKPTAFGCGRGMVVQEPVV